MDAHPAHGERKCNVLVISASDDVELALDVALSTSSVRCRTVRAAAETEGLNVGVVVIANESPLYELIEVRVHPRLHDRPVVLFAPGRRLPDKDWLIHGVWPITSLVDGFDQLIAQVRWLLERTAAPLPLRAVGRNGDENASPRYPFHW